MIRARSLQRQASATCRAAPVRLRSLFLGRRRSTRACCARAPCHAGRGQPVYYSRALCWREATLLRCDRDTTCQLRPPTPSQQASATCHEAQAHAISGTQTCCGARAWCRAGCNRGMPNSRALRQREASLLRSAAVVQGRACAAACHTAPALAVSGEEAQHAGWLLDQAPHFCLILETDVRGVHDPNPAVHTARLLF